MSYEDDLNRAIGERLQYLRTRSNLTQGQLAQRLTAMDMPIAQQTVAKIENGTRPLKLAEAESITQILDVSLDVLVPGEEDEAFAVYELNSLVSLLHERLDTASLHIKAAKDSQERARREWEGASKAVQRAYLAKTGADAASINQLLSGDVAAQAASQVPPGTEPKVRHDPEA